MTNKFYINSVPLDLDFAVRLLKTQGRESLEQVKFYAISEDVKEQIENAWNLPEVTAQEVMSIKNTEQRMVAMSVLGIEKMLSELEHKVIDTQVIKKNNLRWSINKDGKVEEYIQEFEDTYQLLEVGIKTTRFREEETVKLRGVLCSCTSTGRTYFINVPPVSNKGTRWNPDFIWDTDAIEAICRTFKVNVKPEAVKAYRRHGDVILVTVKPEYTDDFLGDWRTISKEEYLSKLESET